ncbi:unnamed protein product [Bursaphelenchus xylophilus]|uniref:(pine wood nematode) hypothetical protein n=1 Tax=Bursaphelenchus xylophilus TaxID=6326 RepID=A0A7I8WFU8_BURXY|nr:unnamed protein product [Bursaphelenchus xylophilus]CAG9111800.1 unnamed protein product [Bursaphelenchus xylophilus]
MPYTSFQAVTWAGYSTAFAGLDPVHGPAYDLRNACWDNEVDENIGNGRSLREFPRSPLLFAVISAFLGLLLFLPKIRSQGYDFGGFFLPPLTFAPVPTTTAIPCAPWTLTNNVVPVAAAGSIDSRPKFVQPSLAPVTAKSTTLRPVSIKMTTTTSPPSSGMVIQWEPSVKRPSPSVPQDVIANKCFRTICKDWVDECHWFCDWIQTNAQQRRCVECLSWRGKHCFSCFQK